MEEYRFHYGIMEVQENQIIDKTNTMEMEF